MTIRRHPFFDGLDWAKLEALEVPPPLVPEVTVHGARENPEKGPRLSAPLLITTCPITPGGQAKGTDNFDAEFTREMVRLTPPRRRLTTLLQGMGVEENFQGFSYVNPAFSLTS